MTFYDPFDASVFQNLTSSAPFVCVYIVIPMAKYFFVCGAGFLTELIFYVSVPRGQAEPSGCDSGIGSLSKIKTLISLS